MMPTYGTSIPDLVFDPLDEDLVETVSDEIRSVVDFDPRVSLISLDVVPDYDNNLLTASLAVFYIELNVSDSFNFNIILNEL
jgi:phage baseplate assembly protein W